MDDSEDDDAADNDTAEDATGPKERRLDEARNSIFAASFSGDGDSLLKKVAFVLNRFPSTRDSDRKLQLEYWKTFESWGGTSIPVDRYLELAPLTSISRARAQIQNKLRLFQASPRVKQRRGKLEESELDRVRDGPDWSPRISVFTDESGKTEDHLIVGGIWISNSDEVFDINLRLREWRRQVGFTSELHFKDIDDSSEARYKQALELVLKASSISFKALRLPRRGHRDVNVVLRRMFYHHIIKGVAHEHESGRCILPRSLEFWKDQEQESQDRLLVADLKGEVLQASLAQFGGKLSLGDFGAAPSKEVDLLQIADLFVSSIGRTINTPGVIPKAKDRFAKYLLSSVGMPAGPDVLSDDSDFATAPRL